MRAREFTINVPITIKINGDGDPEIDMPTQNPEEPEAQELHQNPVMIPPLQQELELQKSAAGKLSPVIAKITADDTIGSESSEDDKILDRLKALISQK